MPSEEERKLGIREQAGIIFEPKNLLKTVASQIPVASIATGMIDQIEAYQTDLRIEALEGRVKAMAQLRALEESVPKMPPPINDWSIPVALYLQRTIDLVVVYDAGFHSPAERGREMIQPVGHGCVISGKEIITSKEALDLARGVAEFKSGNVVIFVGLAWYDFTSEIPDQATGLCLCHLTKRNEEKWKEIIGAWRETGIGDPGGEPINVPVRHSISPWMGQEVGLLYTGEAEDVLRRNDSITKLQFDTTVISHFRKPSDDALKSFVTGVLPGRFLQAGSPAFSRDGTLLGIISATESYKSDSGRRAVVRTFLGHPRFMDIARKGKYVSD